MVSIWMVIGSGGDGSNFTEIVKDKEVLAKMQALANDGDETYASGDGLQARQLKFPDGFDVDGWVKENFFGYTTMGDLE